MSSKSSRIQKNSLTPKIASQFGHRHSVIVDSNGTLLDLHAEQVIFILNLSLAKWLSLAIMAEVLENTWPWL